MCAYNPEDQQNTGVNQKGDGKGEISDCPFLFCPHESPSRVLHPGLGTPEQEKCGTAGAGPEKHENN